MLRDMRSIGEAVTFYIKDISHHLHATDHQTNLVSTRMNSNRIVSRSQSLSHDGRITIIVMRLRSS